MRQLKEPLPYWSYSYGDWYSTNIVIREQLSAWDRMHNAPVKVAIAALRRQALIPIERSELRDHRLRMVLVATRKDPASSKLKVQYKSSTAACDGRQLVWVNFLEDENTCLVHIRADVYPAAMTSWEIAWPPMQEESRAEHLADKAGVSDYLAECGGFDPELSIDLEKFPYKFKFIAVRDDEWDEVQSKFKAAVGKRRKYGSAAVSAAAIEQPLSEEANSSTPPPPWSASQKPYWKSRGHITKQKLQ